MMNTLEKKCWDMWNNFEEIRRATDEKSTTFEDNEDACVAVQLAKEQAIDATIACLNAQTDDWLSTNNLTNDRSKWRELLLRDDGLHRKLVEIIWNEFKRRTQRF